MENAKYTLDGREVEIVAKTETGFVVCDVYDVMQDGEHFEAGDTLNMYFVSKVYDAPPVEKYHEKIMHLKDQIEKLHGDIRHYKSVAKDFKDNYSAIMERLKTFPALKHIERYLNGEITHYVVVEYSWKAGIFPVHDVRGKMGEYGEKLLCLFGGSKGDLQWKINKYNDGSGYWSEVVPFCSYGEALKYLGHWLNNELQKGNKNLSSLVKIADEYGFEIHKRYRKELREIQRQQLEKEYASKLKEVEAIRQKINSMIDLSEGGRE